MDDELVFNPRKMSVGMVEAELAKHPDLTVDELRALLAHEGSQHRPRVGVEELLDARLVALASKALDAAGEDMIAEGAPEVAVEEQGMPATFADGAPAGDPDVEVPPPNEPAEEDQEAPSGDEPPDAPVIEQYGKVGAMFGEHAVVVAAAMLAHEANRAYCELLGDYSQTSWSDAPQWQKDSILAGVIAIADNPSLTPEQSHEGWFVTKKAAGWVYGEEKDMEAKVHPCVLPYGELPADQRLKDSLFGSVVRLILGTPVVVPAGALDGISADDLAELGLCRMMGPDPDNPMDAEGYDDVAANTPVHVAMLNGEEHEGYYVKPIGGAMIRMRDGQDTVIFVPDHSFWVSPSDDDEDSGD